VNLEEHRSFDCFGGTATIHIGGSDGADPQESADLARLRLLGTHQRLPRFIDGSELSCLNRDPRCRVPASPLMLSLARAVGFAGSRSAGLVDATLLDSLERVGYGETLRNRGRLSLSEALSNRVKRTPGGPNPSGHWRSVHVDQGTATIVRPPGVRLDSGGIAKGLVADLIAATLRKNETFAVDCCGDIRIGGTAGLERTVLVEDPFGGSPVHDLKLRDGAVATSGIGRRCWVGPNGRAAHHILDPRSGEPAFTGIVQVSAVAPSALLAEVYAKSALLAGPDRAASWLPHGGVLVRDGEEIDIVAGNRPLPTAPAIS
jgi:FAD:protein FMN transferase